MLLWCVCFARNFLPDFAVKEPWWKQLCWVSKLHYETDYFGIRVRVSNIEHLSHSIDWLIDRSIDWLMDWLIDYLLTYISCVFARMEFRIRCHFHAVNKVAEVGFLEKEAVIKRVRDQVILIKRPKAKAEFRAAIGRRDIKLARDCPTRWNSTHDMLLSAFVLRREIGEFIAKQKGAVSLTVLSPDEWGQVDAFVKFLAPLKAATLACGAGHFATLHLGVPQFNILRTHLHNTMEDHTVSNVFSPFCYLTFFSN